MKEKEAFFFEDEEGSKKMTGHGGVPKLFLLSLIGMLIFTVVYIILYTPEITGWTQYTEIMEHDEAINQTNP